MAAASASVLPPPPAQRSTHLLAGLGVGEQRGELRAFVLDLDQALEVGGLGVHRGAFRHRPRARMRRPCGDQRVGSGARSASASSGLVAVALERVDAQIERRARGERRALLGALVAEHAGEDTDRAIPDSRRAHAAARRRDRRLRAARARPRSAATARSAGRRRACRSPPHRARARAEHAEQRPRAAYPRPSARPTTRAGAARHRRGRRWRRDRRSRRSGATGPSP